GGSCRGGTTMAPLPPVVLAQARPSALAAVLGGALPSSPRRDERSRMVRFGSVHVSREPANGAAGHVGIGIDDEEGGAAVGAAIGTGGGRSPAAHAAHRDGATGHRGGGGT